MKTKSSTLFSGAAIGISIILIILGLFTQAGFVVISGSFALVFALVNEIVRFNNTQMDS